MFKCLSSKRTSFLIINLIYLQFSTAQEIDSFFRVDTIQITGNRKTKEKIILRELTFKTGDSMKNWKYHSTQSRKQLINLFIFNEINISRKNNTVLIHITERWYIWPIPILDYADRNFNQWWLTKDPKRLIYGVNLECYNLRGRNETMIVSLISGYTRIAGISYKIPYFNKKQTWGLQLSAGYSSNREVWYKTYNDKVQFFKDQDRTLIKRKSAEIIFTHRKKVFTYHHFYTGYKQIEIDDSVNTKEVNVSYLIDNLNVQKEFYSGYQYVSDRRDMKGFPLKGHLLKANSEISSYKIPGTSQISDHFSFFNTLIIKATYSLYRSLGKGFYLSGNLTGRYYSNPNPPYSRIQALGYGKDYIRGYELNVIDGQNFGLFKSELKYRIHNRTYKFLSKLKNYEVLPLAIYVSSYFDMGYVENKNKIQVADNHNNLPNSLQHGGGAGLNMVAFYDYCLRLEYSLDKYLNHRFYLSFVASM